MESIHKTLHTSATIDILWLSWGKVLLWLSCQLNCLLSGGTPFLFKRMTVKAFYRKKNKMSLLLQGKQLTVLVPMLNLDLLCKKLEFLKALIRFCEPDSFLIVKTYDEICGTIKECEFLILYIGNLEDAWLTEPLFSNSPLYDAAELWVKDVFRVQSR